MNNKSSLAAFFLALIPGLGHLYINRKGRAFFYGLCFFGPLFLGLLASIAARDGKPFAIAAFLFTLVWLINMIDMLVTLLANRPISIATDPDQTGGSVPGESLLHQRERFYTILLSPIPGLAHFQLGLMTRGVTFLIAFFGSFVMILFVAALSRHDGFLVFLGVLPVIWLYSLFDGLQLLARKQRGEELVDRTVFEDFEQGREAGKRSKILAMLLSVFPGAGHMYLGLQKRGLQLMIAFLFTIYILDVLRLSLFLFVIPLIWFYSFFDTLQQLSRLNQGELQDVPIVSWLVHQQKWLGIGLIVLGVFYLADRVLLTVIEQLYPQLNIAYWLETYFQTFLVSVLLIGGGLKLLTGSKINKGDENR